VSPSTNLFHSPWEWAATAHPPGKHVPHPADKLSESWKNEQGEYETRTEWHRVYAWGNLANFAKTLSKGQLVSLEGKIKYRVIEETVKGQQVKYTIAEIHASSIRRLSKVEAADDPSDGADEA
jgi:single-strand DNA-binding protein